MKNYNNKKSILERGGLMIEALAMLGLIAVVTPTMYKKSAERTMEVEDINTATTMRTFMNAAEAYMNANYINIMKETEGHMQPIGEDENAPKIGVVTINPADLEPYLPYKYAESGGLYNYNAPTVRVVRSGDNLTAFALFPAKVGGEEGVGQERTVRIASLIGANGGYVPTADSQTAKSARGVGGVWNLDNDHYKAVFGESNDAKQFSLVTSSSNVVNSSTAAAQADNTKYLQRTKENGDGELWRNAMRTDLYMGGADSGRDPDKMNENGFFSIKNINQLIVNAETATGSSVQGTQDAAATTIEAGTYGLYINKATGEGATQKGGINAYIAGTLQAAGNQFWATDNTLKYKGTNLEFDGTNFRIGLEKEDATDKKKNVYVLDGVANNAGSSTLNVMGDKIQVAEAGNIGNYKPNAEVQKKANVVINTTNKKGSQETNPLTIDAPKYSADNKAPEFGVDVSGNMVVEGALAAGQLDTNKIRASSLSVGSANIDDAKKWMDVDKDGVHIHQPKNGAHAGTQIEAREGFVAMRVGESNTISTSTENPETAAVETDNDAQILMSSGGITEKVASGKNLTLAGSGVGVQINDSNINIGNSDARTLNTNNGTPADYQVTFESGGDVNVDSSNLSVKADSAPVFTVRGKESFTGQSGDTNNRDKLSGLGGYRIAGHGNTLFTSGMDSGTDTNVVRYLSMSGSLPKENNVTVPAAVNIIGGQQDSGDLDQAKGVMYIDLDDRGSNAYAQVQVNDNPEQGVGENATSTRIGGDEILAGGIYIRKGLIDIVPDSSQSNAGFKDQNNPTVYQIGANTADDGMGVIRASRLVANNVTTSGKRVMVPEFFDNTIYSEYNGADGTTRYDTYMVNPAYTSVMNDIKLVSRGGARLSDILPVFITKGIYTAVNNYGESAFNKSDFSDGSGLYINSDNILNIKTCPSTNPNSCPNDINEPASPIIGLVPLPQCPPGYARMITVTPANIRMAEAGRFKNAYYNEKFRGIDIDVDDFTNPTNSDYFKDNKGNIQTIDSLDEAALARMSETDRKKLKESQVMKLYAAYISTKDSEGRYAVTNMNPTYQGGVHLTGGDESWSGMVGSNKVQNPEGFQGKMELDVANRDYNLTEDEIISTSEVAAVTGSNGAISKERGGRRVTSSETDRNSTSSLHDVGHTVTHKIEETNTTDKNVYNTVPSTDDEDTTSSGYVKTANIISNDINSQLLTIHDQHQDNNNSQHQTTEPRHYKLKNDIDISGTRILADRIRNVQFEGKNSHGVMEKAYVLTSKNPNYIEPMTFQKSTWLKTAAIPVAKQGKDVASGWTILMGFIYPRAAYQNILTTLQVADQYQKFASYGDATARNRSGFDTRDRKYRVVGRDSNGNAIYDSTEEFFYWNIFPVEQESLEAYITTYCYFDQNNNAYGMFKNSGKTGNEYNTDSEVKGHLPMIDYITTFPEGYEPTGDNKRYRQMLNDPSMKYNELW